MKAVLFPIAFGILFVLLVAGCEPLAGNLGGDAARFLLNTNPEPNSLYLEMDQAALDANVGDEVQLHLIFNEMDHPVFTLGFDVDYDEDALQYVSFEEGTFFSADGTKPTVVIQPINDPSDGYLSDGAISILGQYPGATGTGTVATFTFKILKEGYADVSLEKVSAFDANTESIPFTVVNGKVYVTSSCLTDEDMDGYGVGCDNGPDCADDNFYVNPGREELCDQIDNNCDGNVDEGCSCTDGAVRYCGTNVGVCEYGEQTCDNGVWGSCEGGIAVEPDRPESCNGLDDDCDGQVDEGLSKQCSDTFKGVCAVGTLSCTDGSWGGCPLPSDEVCGDNLDNDCDGQVDEGCGCTTGDTRPCGTKDEGACSFGTQQCTDGAWGNCIGAVYPADEVCNNIDDDCDGQVDEGLVISCGVNHKGICASGDQVCQEGEWSGCPTPQTETCGDGIDQDCDGSDLACDGAQGTSWSLCLDTRYGEWGHDTCALSNCPENYYLVNCQKDIDGNLREVCIKFTQTSCSDNPVCSNGEELDTLSCQDGQILCTQSNLDAARADMTTKFETYTAAKEAYANDPQNPDKEAAYMAAQEEYLISYNTYQQTKESCFDITTAILNNFKEQFIR
ncbi:MAG: hypothetical protein GXP63_02870 [DPANN group archaeon]|nr:hypothetical protein [DPANN group archaeon]